MPEEQSHELPTIDVGSEPATTPVSRAAQTSWTQSMAIPGAIVFSALIIAGAIYLDGEQRGGAKTALNLQESIEAAQQAQATAESVVAPVTEDDAIRGNPNAPIMIVEYSDYDCPFCKNFHETMNRIIDEYGADGDVAWVYRQFPLEQLHPNAPKISEAAYCVMEQGGDEAFWKFSDFVFETRDINAQTDMTKLNGFATQSGVDAGKFELCLNSGKYTEKVVQDVQAAIATGARGTPHSFVVVGDQKVAINGAQPYSTIKQAIDNILSQMNGGTN